MSASNNVTDTSIRPKPDVELATQRQLQTTKTDFGTQLKTGISATGRGLAAAVGIAGPAFPGGAVLTAAISGVGSLKSSVQAGGANSTGVNGPVGGGGGGSGQSFGAGGSDNFLDQALQDRALSGDKSAQDSLAQKQMLAETRSSNYAMLQLQEGIQRDARTYLTLSNVLRSRFEVDRNAISNAKI